MCHAHSTAQALFSLTASPFLPHQVIAKRKQADGHRDALMLDVALEGWFGVQIGKVRFQKPARI